MGYRFNCGSTYTEDHTNIVIEFICYVIFNSIEFAALMLCNIKKNHIALLLQGHETSVTINENKHMLCYKFCVFYL